MWVKYYYYELLAYKLNQKKEKEMNLGIQICTFLAEWNVNKKLGVLFVCWRFFMISVLSFAHLKSSFWGKTMYKIGKIGLQSHQKKRTAESHTEASELRQGSVRSFISFFMLLKPFLVYCINWSESFSNLLDREQLLLLLQGKHHEFLKVKRRMRYSPPVIL